MHILALGPLALEKSYLEVTEPTEILTRPTGFLGFFRELGAVEVDWPPLSLCTNKVIFSVVWGKSAKLKDSHHMQQASVIFFEEVLAYSLSSIKIST